jgi:hypothetical protein
MNIFAKLVRMNDENVSHALSKQVRDSNSRFDGGIIQEHYGIPTPSHGGTAGYMASMSSALVTPESRSYRDPQLLAALESAAEYMLRRQNEDGTISLGGTNFNSPPDTGFVVVGMSQIYLLLLKHPWEPLGPVIGKIKLFLERTIPALLTGGCHTPNHRWVITAALGFLFEIFRIAELLTRANEWLAEGMDCTEEGEWTERSNGIYNTVSDIMLFYTAKYCKRPEVLTHVRQNLNMMVYMVHHDGEVVTDYSGRQDLGVKHDLSEYFLSYRLMAEYDRNPLYASMYDLTAATMTRLGPVNNHSLLGYLMFPCDLDPLERQPLPEQYRKVFHADHSIEEDLRKLELVGHHSKIQHSSMHTSFGAPVVRYRQDETSVTAMTRTPTFFSLRHGDARLLGMSILTMFTPGIVELEQFTMTEQGFRMQTTMEKGYRGPIPSMHLPETARTNRSPWYLLPHHLRPSTHVQQHQIDVEIVQQERDWLIRVKSDSRQDVMTQIAFMFDQDSSIIGEGLEPVGEGLMLWKEKGIRCTLGRYGFDISSGQHDHGLVKIPNSSLQSGAQTVLVNLLTPFSKEFRITLFP